MRTLTHDTIDMLVPGFTSTALIYITQLNTFNTEVKQGIINTAPILQRASG